MEKRSARDGTTLAVREWPAAPARASILLVHGLGEHSGRWEHVGQFFQREGFDATAFDLRGHGHSGGRRAYVRDWAQYLDDVEDMLATLEGPKVLYGHSLGGLIVTSYAVSDRPQPDLLVASAPGLDDNLAPILHVLSKILGPIVPTLSVAAGIKGEQLTHDPEVAKAYDDDPMVLKKTTAKLGYEALQERPKTIELIGRIGIPTLTIHGSEDPIVPPSASTLLEPHATRIVYEGFRHECHNEIGKERVLGDIVNWIDEQLQA
jgi:alpha-beta hydrolase superfamily lysophospholipase